MRFGVFYEHQLPRPRENGSELQLFQDALAQVELADRIGLTITQPIDLEKMPEANRHRILAFRRMREIMEGR